MKKKLKICNDEGLHMRPSSQLVSLTENFDGEIYIHFNGEIASTKNIMELMFLSLCLDDEFIIEIISNKDEYNEAKKDENDMFHKIQNLIEIKKFDENKI